MTKIEKTNMIVSQKIKKILLFVFFMAFYGLIFAQFQNGSNMSFGKNRIQYSQRNWSYYRTDFADIHYYTQTKKLAEFAAQNIPQILSEMEEKIGIQLSHKMLIIIYARQSDFNQSNIGLESDDFYNTGGVSSIFGNKIFLYFKGNLQDFYTDLRKGIARLLIETALSGGSVAANMAASYVADFPVWFTDGLSNYLTTSWDINIESQIIDEVQNGNYKKIHFLPVQNQIVAGMSWWKFIEDEYGFNTISALLYYSSKTRNFEKGCLYAIGKPYKELYAEWIAYCKKTFVHSAQTEILENNVIKTKKSTNYLFPKISPDGNLLAYTSNKEGKLRVCLFNLETKKKKNIYFKNHSIEDNPDMSFPIPLWNPSGKILYLMEEWHDKVYLLPYNITKNKYEKRQVIFINKITSLAYSSDGKRIVLSGVNNGQSDIYVYNMASKSLEQITDDLADDFAPAFIHNNNQIIFSSNRICDTLDCDNNYQTGKYDIFIYDYENKDKNLIRISQQPQYADVFAMEMGENMVTFLRNESNKITRYAGEFQNVISRIDTAIHYAYQLKPHPIATYETAIGGQDISQENQIIFSQIKQDGQWKINQNEWKNIPTFTQNTIIQSDTIEEEEQSTISMPVHKKRLRQMRLSDFLSADSTLLDTNYQDMVFKIEKNTIENNKTLIPRNLYTQYYLNKLITQADFSFLNISYQQFVNTSSPIYLNSGFNGLFMVGLSDLMEDHRMIGGIRLSILNLGDMEMLYSYENLKKRWDKQFITHYQTQRYENEYQIIKQQNLSFYFLLKYPFDKVHSLRFTFGGRYNRQDYKAIDDISLKKKPEHNVWGESKIEYIVDYTRPIGINMLKGLRGKIFAEFSGMIYKHVDSLSFSQRFGHDRFNYMINLGFDFRHYTKIHPTLVWANRLAGSTSLGYNKLIYYLGGVDNWIFAKFNNNIPIDRTNNYAYQTLATNMRGFSQNIRNGSNFFVFNTELRWQFLQTFIKRPIRSEFLRSLQLLGFFDIGTAWSGISPYSEDNALFTQTITRGESIKITLHKQTEPIVYGFGVGIRFMLFSYFIRLDYGFGVENNKINYKQGYISFNLDF